LVDSILHITCAVVLSYLLGSIPFGLMLGRIFYKKDIRDLGSKNIGAANIMRNFGTLPGVLVLLLDALKGFLSAGSIPYLFDFVINSRVQSSELFILVSIFCGLAAIAGHNWSIFINFKGGKGVAASIGVALALAPKEAGIAFAVFMVLVLITGYVSIGSIAGSLIFLLALILIKEPLALQIFGILAFGLIFIRHIPNIKRLIKGTEPRVWQKKSQ